MDINNILSSFKNPWIIGTIIICIIIVSILIYKICKSNFKSTIITPLNELDNTQPKSFPSIKQPNSPLVEPVVPEEVGLAMVYPQGTGVGMSKNDSNSFTKPQSVLLTDISIPEAYGESSLADPTGNNGAKQGSRIIKIKNTGNQLNYKPNDESRSESYAMAYSSSGEIQKGHTFINGTQQVNYNDSFNPENNLKLQSSPGQESTLPNCESTYPNTVKYNDFCITEGDIPYGQVVNGKVNPRLVSRWESFTGDYSREEALKPIDGVLYPELSVLK